MMAAVSVAYVRTATWYSAPWNFNDQINSPSFGTVEREGLVGDERGEVGEVGPIDDFASIGERAMGMGTPNQKLVHLRSTLGLCQGT